MAARSATVTATPNSATAATKAMRGVLTDGPVPLGGVVVTVTLSAQSSVTRNVFPSASATVMGVSCASALVLIALPLGSSARTAAPPRPSLDNSSVPAMLTMPTSRAPSPARGTVPKPTVVVRLDSIDPNAASMNTLMGPATSWPTSTTNAPNSEKTVVRQSQRILLPRAAM